jgi:alpha-L-rhamnosidase
MGVSLLCALLLGQTTPPTIDPSYGLAVPPISRAKASPRQDAHWIWSSVTKDHQTVYFRRRFNLTSSPKIAMLFITADNNYQLSVDGKPLVTPPAGDEAWKQVNSYNLSLSEPGRHEIDVTAENLSGPAGLLARLETDGKAALLSDGAWEVAGAPTGPFVKATVENIVGEGPWGRDIAGWPAEMGSPPLYLKSMPVDPVCFSGAGPDPDQLHWKPIREKLVPVPPSDGIPRRIVVDFGQELSGNVACLFRNPENLTVTLGTGESAGEAMNKPWTSKTVTSPKGGIVRSDYTAFRYACIQLPPSSQPTSFKVLANYLYYPVAYQGTFNCSDPLLTQIWYTGAYTAHLCMQDDIWDAPKRDRARWMGDLHVSGETINNAFLDKFLMEQTLTRLREDAQGGAAASELPKTHVNQIPGYSCAWIAGLADFYRHTGDLAFIKSQREPLISLISFMKGDEENGVFVNKRGEWPFVDWSPDFDKDSPETRASTHLFMIYAAKEAAFLFSALGDPQNRASSLGWAASLESMARAHLQDADGTFGLRRQENAMAVYSGTALPASHDAIYGKVFAPDSPSWNQIATPYYNNYVIFAMSELGHTQDAMDFVRRYWGGMIKEGATSFWESYDQSWNKHDSHLHLNADDGTGYFVSLSHGWSTGATNWLTERVLGVRPSAGGFSKCDIQPDLGDLAWAEGDVPTPHGLVHVKASQSGIEVKLPKGVTATVVYNGKSTVLDASRHGLATTVN